MAHKKSELIRTVTLTEHDYHVLLEDHITLKALKLAGIESMPIFKGMQSILSNEHIEVRIKPLKRNYR